MRIHASSVLEVEQRFKSCCGSDEKCVVAALADKLHADRKTIECADGQYNRWTAGHRDYACVNAPRTGAASALPVIPFRSTRISKIGRKGDICRDGAAQDIVPASACLVKQCRQLVLKMFGILFVCVCVCVCVCVWTT